MNNLGLSFFDFIVAVIQGALFTPVVLSFVAFIIFVPMLFFDGPTNPLIALIPEGSYDTADILGIYGKFALGASMIIAIVEMLLRKRFNINEKTKAILLSLILMLGYFLMFVLFVAKSKADLIVFAIALAPLLLGSLGALYVNFIISRALNFMKRD